HQVPTRDSPPAPGDHRVELVGERPQGHAAVYFSMQKNYTAASLLSKTHTAHRVKHTQHTVNPLIAADANPFLPSVISTVSVLFISTDHCISVIGMSVAVSQFPPSVRMPTAVL
ncbi:unnamed protein product, partial [Staurois parvus]